jgi:hypothetical protein
MENTAFPVRRRTLLRGAAAVGLTGSLTATFASVASPASAAVPTPRIIPCPEWGARAPRPLNVLPNNPNKILIHHTAGPNSADLSEAHAHAMARGIQADHMDSEGWPDSGQHFTVSRGGFILEGRHESLPTLQAGRGMVEGTHCPGQNTQAIGIENEGTYIDVAPPGTLYAKLVDLCAYICQQYGLPATAIYGHRDFSSTQCPGDRFYAMLPQLRRDVAARLSGGGADEIGVYRPSGAMFYLRNTGAARLGNPNFVPVTGDWNGNGIDTIGVYRPDNRTFYLRNTNASGNADIVCQFGNPDDVPLVGDWNGDGVDTVGVYRPSNQHFYLKNANDNSPADIGFRFGNPGDIPFVGDWDGNGTHGVGVYRLSNRTFYLRNALSAGDADRYIVFGNTGDKPIIGNWDGDRYDTIGAYRPGNGYFYLKNRNTAGPADVTVHYGSPGDIPLSGRWR